MHMCLYICIHTCTVDTCEEHVFCMCRNVPVHIDQTCHFFVYSKSGVMERCQREKTEAYYSFSRLVWCFRSSTDSAVLWNRPCSVLVKGCGNSEERAWECSVGHWREGCVEGVAWRHSRKTAEKRVSRESSHRRDRVWGCSVHTRLNLGGRTREVMGNWFLRQKMSHWKLLRCRICVLEGDCGRAADVSSVFLSSFVFYPFSSVSLGVVIWVDESSSKGK